MNEFKTFSELEQLSWEYSDYFKSAYGFRPRHIDTSTWTVEDFEREFEVLGAQCAENEQRRVAAEAQAAHDFELRIQSLLASGAKDRLMAIRWLQEAHETNDPSYFCFLLGLPDDYFAGDFF